MNPRANLEFPGRLPPVGSRKGSLFLHGVALSIIVGLAMGIWACSTPPPQPRVSKPPAAPGGLAGSQSQASQPVRVQEGIASWYGPGFHGNPTSSGETYDMFQMTAAHRTLPLGTRVLVTNLENHRTVEVTVNDRGPFVKDRVIDLSYSAARVLGMVGPGTTRVRLEILSDPPGGEKADFSAKPFYSLQLGAFSDPARAQALKKELEGLAGSPEVRITQVRMGSMELHRVRVGRYEDREQAVAKANELAQKGYVVLVVPD